MLSWLLLLLLNLELAAAAAVVPAPHLWAVRLGDWGGRRVSGGV